MPIYYDPMLAKLCARGPDRETAIARLDRALSEYVVSGIKTNIPWLRRVLAHDIFQSGDYDTSFLDKAADDLKPRPSAELEEVAVLAGGIVTHDRYQRLAAQAATKGEGGKQAENPWKLQGRFRVLRR